MGTFITTSSRGNTHPLAFQGLLAVECYSQLMELIRPRLGDSYVLLFAAPEFDAEQETVDWYSPVLGQIGTLTELPPERQDAVRAELKKMGLELCKLAETLKHSGEPQRVIGGNLLELALCYPDESCIRMVGDQPVIICWGFEPSSPGAQPQELSRLVVGSPAPHLDAPRAPVAAQPALEEPAIAAPVSEATGADRRASGWFWLLPLLLLLLVLALLFVRWCGRPPLVRLPGVELHGPTFFCPEDPATAALKAELALQASLTAEQDGLRAHVAQCTAKSSAVVRGKEAAGNNELSVPEQAVATGDLRFLGGVWRCDTGLSSTRTGLPVRVEYTFDTAGKGTLSIQGDKGVCSAPVTASLSADGVLSIESAREISCPSGTPYSGQRVECAGKGAEAVCTGRNLSAGAQAWNAVFQRK
ncbi:MAG: SrfA family protein [Bilophila sp.]